MAKKTLQQYQEEARAAGIPESFIQAQSNQAPQLPSSTQNQYNAPNLEEPKSMAQNLGESVVGSVWNPIAGLYNKAVSTTAGNEKSKGDIGKLIVKSASDTAETFTSPEAARASAVPASFAVPFGKAGFFGSKFLAPGAATGTLSGISQGDSPMELVGDALLGAGTAGGAQLLGKTPGLISKGVQKYKDDVTEAAGQGIGKASPTAWRKAAEEHGVDLNDLIQKYVPEGAGHDELLGKVAERGNGGEIGSALKVAEDEIQNTIKLAGSTIRIPAETFLPQLKAEAKSLAMLPGNENKIQAINTIVKQFEKQYANGLSAQRALDLKRAADSKFGQSVVNDEVGNTASIAQKMVANASRAALKQMFPELEQALGTQSDLLTLRPILSHARAISKTQGSEIRSGKLNNLDLMKPATWFTAIPDAVMSNPKAASWIMGKTNRMGSLPNKTLPEPAQNIAGQVASRMPFFAGSNENQEANAANYPGNNQEGFNINGQESNNKFHNVPDDITTMGLNQDPNVILPGETPEQWMRRVQQSGSQGLGATPQEAFSQAQQSSTGKTLNPYGASPQELYREYVNATMAGDSKMATFLKGMYSDEIKFQENQGGTAKPLSAVAQVYVTKAKSGLSSMARMEEDLQKNPNAYFNKINPFDQSGRQLGADQTSVIDIIGYFRTGAAITPDQRKDYVYMFPNLLDDEQTRRRKMNAIRTELQGYAGVGTDIPELAPSASSGSLPATPGEAFGY